MTTVHIKLAACTILQTSTRFVQSHTKESDHLSRVTTCRCHKRIHDIHAPGYKANSTRGKGSVCNSTSRTEFAEAFQLPSMLPHPTTGFLLTKICPPSTSTPRGLKKRTSRLESIDRPNTRSAWKREYLGNCKAAATLAAARRRADYANHHTSDSPNARGSSCFQRHELRRTLPQYLEQHVCRGRDEKRRM